MVKTAAKNSPIHINKLIFWIKTLSGPNTVYGSLVYGVSPQRRGQAEGAAPRSIFSCLFLLICFGKISGWNNTIP
jgi:hypothetical protein